MAPRPRNPPGRPALRTPDEPLAPVRFPRPDLALLGRSFRFLFRHFLRLLPLAFLSYLVSDSLLLYAHSGTLHRALHPNEQPPYLSQQAMQALPPLLFVLAVSLPLLNVCFLALLSAIEQCALTGRVDYRIVLHFVRRRFVAGFRGTFVGLWRFCWVAFLGILVGMILITLTTDFGSATLRTILVQVAGGIALIAALPAIFATYWCIYLDPMPFGNAYAEARAFLTGRRRQVIVTLLISLAPLILVPDSPEGSLPLAVTKLLVSAACSLPFLIVLYHYYIAARAQAPVTSPLMP